MINRPWRVQFTAAELPSPVSPLPFVADLPEGWTQWLAGAEVEAGTPFLLSPLLEYDVTFERVLPATGDDRRGENHAGRVREGLGRVLVVHVVGARAAVLAGRDGGRSSRLPGVAAP